MNEDQRKVIIKEIKFVHDRHVQEVLAAIEQPLKMIHPNNYVNLGEMTNLYNKSVGASIEKFRVESVQALDAVLTKLKEDALKNDEKELVLKELEIFIEPTFYEKRFNVLVNSVIRHLSRYGISYEPEQPTLSHGEALSRVHAVNSMRNIKAQLANVLEMRVHSTADKGEDILKLEPKFMGMGINLNALFKKFRNRRT